MIRNKHASSPLAAKVRPQESKITAWRQNEWTMTLSNRLANNLIRHGESHVKREL